MDTLELDGLTVDRDGAVLLDHVDLRVGAGERVALVGPSGAGKTTLLRCVAGLATPAAGAVRLGGDDVTHAPPGARDVVYVPQDAPLLPHLDVEHNVGFPLVLRRRPREEVEERTRAEGRAFAIRHLFPRRPNQLAAGERSSVALARSLVRRGRALLLDEPFARLDAHRRQDFARELVAVQNGYGVTMLLATNDQRIASAVGERVAVLDSGRLRQVDRPDVVYARPADTFVAGFVGEPPMNLLPGLVDDRADPHAARLTVVGGPRVRHLAGLPLLVGIRPTALEPARVTHACRTAGRVVRAVFVGHGVEVTLDTPAGAVLAVVPAPGPVLGEAVELGVRHRDVHLFDPITGEALAHGA
ncbi:ABC transporter ATP-binding protein [Egicoccus sp. AB-alg2]|uniref:ABC transporter ATP-binding protein n=1 Tax=Egicoccus sp. AB-alg2 TaxID=3242693 RepID=UPI00359ED45C